MRNIPISSAVLATVLGLAAQSQAALQFSTNVSGSSFSCTDQAACDTNLAVGSLGLGTAATPVIVNGVELYGSLQIASSAGGVFSLNSSSLQILNTSGAFRNITAAVSATDFAGPVNTFFSSGSGTFFDNNGQSIALSYFNDAANGQGADDAFDTPGLLVDSFGFGTGNTPAGTPVSFSHNGTGPVVDPNAFSMTMQAVFGLNDGGQLVSRGQAIVKTNVPEPTSLALLGAGLLGLAGVARRRSA